MRAWYEKSTHVLFEILPNIEKKFQPLIPWDDLFKIYDSTHNIK